MRIKTYNKRRRKKHNFVKFQTSELLKWCSSMKKTHFDIEAYRSLETEDYFAFREEIEEIKCR